MSDSTGPTELIFVGGASSAEAKFLQQVLDRHPEISAGPGFPHLPDVVELRSRMRQSIDRGWIDLICSHEDVDARLRDFLEGLLLPAASRAEGRLLVDGAPGSASVFPELAQMLPDARFIHVVRDPRAAVAATLQAGDRLPRKSRGPLRRWKGVEDAIRQVGTALEGGFRAAREVPDRVLTLTSRDLSSDPEPAIRRLCAFLGVEWIESMLESADLPQQSERAVDPWAAELSAGAQVAISTAFQACGELAQLGYDLSPRSLGPGTRLLGSLTSSLSRRASKLERLARRARRKLRSAIGRSSHA